MKPFEDLSPTEMDPQNEDVITFLSLVHGIPAGAKPGAEQQALALTRVRQRLLEAQPELFEAATSTLRPPLRLVSSAEAPAGLFQPSEKRTTPASKNGWQRRLPLLAAVLVAALLVSSMLAVFSLAKRSSSVATAPQALYVLSWDRAWLQKFAAQNGTLLWKYRLSNQVPNTNDSMVEGHDIVLVTAQQKLLALRASDGTLLWSEGIDGTAVQSVVEGNTLYLLLANQSDGFSSTISLEAFNISSGLRLWHYDRNSLFLTFSVVNGIVYGGVDLSSSHTNKMPDHAIFDLFALRAADGSLQWQAHIDNPLIHNVRRGLTVADGKIYIGTVSGLEPAIYAYSASNGAFLWHSSRLLPTMFLMMRYSLAAQNTLYVSAEDPFGGLYAFNEQNGSLLWSHTRDERKGPKSWISTSFALKSGKIFAVEGDNTGMYIVELNASNGHVIARHPVEHSSVFSEEAVRFQAARLISANTSYLASSGDSFSAYDNQTGHRLWSAKLIESSIPDSTQIFPATWMLGV